MKLKRIVLMSAVLVFSAAMVAFAVQNMGNPKFLLDGGSKGKINFPHSLHQETLKDCKACHDTFPMEPGAILKMKNQEELKKKQVMNTVCIACHKLYKAEGKEAGPVKCSECHTKS